MTSGHIRHGIAVGLILSLLAVVAAAAWWWQPGLALDAWRHGEPPAAWAAARRQNLVWRRDGLERRVDHDWVPLSELPVCLPVAVLVSEDVRFLHHGAVDFRAIGEALSEWTRGRRLRGASTISQQLARILFLSPERSLVRKAREARLAWWLERRLGKRRILELYLNVVEFGPGLAGVEVSSRRYYGLSATEVDPLQAAGLAACIPAPARDNPATASPQWTARRDVIARRSARAEWLVGEVERLIGR